MNKLFLQIRDFLTVPFNRNLTILLAILGIVLLFTGSGTTQEMNTSYNITIDFFYLPTCPHCAEQKPFNEQLMQEFPQIIFIYHDASNPEEHDLLMQKAIEHGIDTSKLGVPATFFEDHYFIGYNSQVGGKIRETIIGCIENCTQQPVEQISALEPEKIDEIEVPFLGKIDVTSFSFPVLAVVLGLVDGFNPCAMWVLVYLIALLMEVQDRKRVWLIVGTFVMASGILYFLFMTAWLNAFLFMGYIRAVTIIIGLFALGAGIISIKAYFETKGSLTCKVVGEDDKKKTAEKMEMLANAPLTLATMVGIIFLAFAVNSIEFVCSAAIPAVFTQVLAIANLSFWEYYAYIALYTFFFMLDDLIIFGMAAFAISGGLGEKYAKYCKFIGGAIMLILGMILLFAPNLLR